MTFREKCFSCYTLLTDQISLPGLPLLLEILVNMCIAIVCQQDRDVMDFENNLIFLIKPFSYMTKKSRRELNILRTKRAFKVKYKTFFIFFKELSNAQNCLRP